MSALPDSSDRMAGEADSIALIKVRQAHRLLVEAVASPTFAELDVVLKARVIDFAREVRAHLP